MALVTGGVASGVAAGADALGIDFNSIRSGVLSIFGGASCSAQQKEQRSKIAAALNQYTTRRERKRFINSHNMENPPEPTGENMAWFYLGGDDCKHKNVTPGDQSFLDSLEGWLNEKIAAASQVPGDPYSQNDGFTNQPTDPPPAAATAPAGGFNSRTGLYILPVVIAGLIGLGVYQSRKG